MIKKVFVVVVACIHLVNCFATIAIRQKTSAGEYPEDTLLVDFSMISESCANETIYLISASYEYGSITTCSSLNDTYSRCDINIFSEQYQNDCNTRGGLFYSDTELDDEPKICLYIYGEEKTHQREVFATNYPFCASTSCNESEILLAYNATMLADSESGQLGLTYSVQCNFFSLMSATSNTYRSYIAVGGIIYVTLAMFSSVMLLSL